jgi:tetrahydroxynaphthalene reductase
MDATNGHANGEAPLNGHTNGYTNGNAAPVVTEVPVPTNGHAAPVVAEAPTPTNGRASTEPEITRIRGPLGLGSASLAGKIALVTGSGT